MKKVRSSCSNISQDWGVPQKLLDRTLSDVEAGRSDSQLLPGVVGMILRRMNPSKFQNQNQTPVPGIGQGVD